MANLRSALSCQKPVIPLRDEEPLMLDRCVLADDEGHLRAGADERHVAQEDVQ